MFFQQAFNKLIQRFYPQAEAAVVELAEFFFTRGVRAAWGEAYQDAYLLGGDNSYFYTKDNMLTQSEINYLLRVLAEHSTDHQAMVVELKAYENLCWHQAEKGTERGTIMFKALNHFRGRIRKAKVQTKRLNGIITKLKHAR